MINDKKEFNWKTLPELFFEEAKKQLDKPLLWYKTNNQYSSVHTITKIPAFCLYLFHFFLDLFCLFF